MDSEYDFYEKIDSMPWTKHASFLMILCEYALEKLKSASQDHPALQTEQQTCQNLTELVALGWDIISNPPNNLSALDTYLSPEGEKYSDMSLFIAPPNNTDHSPPPPNIQHYFIRIF